MARWRKAIICTECDKVYRLGKDESERKIPVICYKCGTRLYNALGYKNNAMYVIVRRRLLSMEVKDYE